MGSGSEEPAFDASQKKGAKNRGPNADDYLTTHNELMKLLHLVFMDRLSMLSYYIHIRNGDDDGGYQGRSAALKLIKRAKAGVRQREDESLPTLEEITSGEAFA